jgi:hypothetical protein
MTQREIILQELNELNSTLATASSQNIYTIPAGYFEGLIDQVMNRIRAMEASNAGEELGYLSPLLSNTTKQMPYSVPQGYFDGLEKTMLQSVLKSNETAKEEIETLSPLLSGLKKEISARPHRSDGPYSVPAGYFENLGIAAKEVSPEVKVIPFTNRKWFRYAAAAVVTGIMAITGILIYQKNNSSEKSLARLEKKINKEIKKASDKELDDFLQYTDAGLDGTEKASVNPDTETKELLKDIPDSELKEFLDETSDETEPGSENIKMN